MYAGFYPSLAGEPWEAWMDRALIEDYNWGCTALAMALRARRTEAEVVARLEQLGRPMRQQPAAKKIRNTTWTRR
jgi:hypothetical protein